MTRTRLSLLVGLVGLAACYVTRVSDENVVVEYAASEMACDPSVVRLEVGSPPEEGIARYVAHGCGRDRTIDCRNEGANVVCGPAGRVAVEPVVASDGAVGSTCACARAGPGVPTSTPRKPRWFRRQTTVPSAAPTSTSPIPSDAFRSR